MALGTELSYFQFLELPENARSLDNFTRHMTAKDVKNKAWFSVVDLASIFGPTEQLSPDQVLMVDIGGNVGHDILAFERAHSNFPGKLVLQDLPQVLEKLERPSSSKLRIMPHDFFLPQPVIAAKVYYMHHVLHDWPDDKCRLVLSNIVPALERDYSKILIHDAIIPSQGAGWQVTGSDLCMLALACAAERTAAQWRLLLGDVGLKLVKIWDCDGSPEKIIEAELDDEPDEI